MSKRFLRKKFFSFSYYFYTSGVGNVTEFEVVYTRIIAHLESN